MNCLMKTIACMAVSLGASAGQPSFPIWPAGKVPLLKETKPEVATPGRDGVTRVTNVSEPSLTPFALAKGEPAPAVLVCPGGGYGILAWDLEGTEIAQWLNAQGIAAFVLKYRVPGNQRDAALCDAQRAMGLLRARASEFGIDPARLGIMGFSAGAHLAVRTCAAGGKRLYGPLDAADRLPCRPDFALVIYPAYLSRKGFELAPGLAVTRELPPTFLAQAEDDRAYVDSSLAYFAALKAAGVPAELHLFPNGGHGFGLRKHGTASDAWGDLAKAWLARLPKRLN